jgi:LPPG:FO 2-phospho-L-lactate transferase
MLALAGGVGGSRLADGLAQIAGGALAVIVNTADDFEHCALHICPDLDTVMYALAGIANPETGWGVNDESWNCLAQIRALGGPDWFRLGDRDLATHIIRSARLRDGESLTMITADLSRRLGIGASILPMSDSPIRTRILTEHGDIGFQDYFVRMQCDIPVKGFHFAGAASSTISTQLEKQLSDVSHDMVIVCPSNPFVSIDPILAIPKLRERLADGTRPIVAVSPIVGGKGVKGPIAKMMYELGLPVSSVSVAKHYRGFIHGLVIDYADAEEAVQIEALDIRVKITNTMMTDRAARRALAECCIEFGRDIVGAA